jgi:hypothetical protein
MFLSLSRACIARTFVGIPTHAPAVETIEVATISVIFIIFLKWPFQHASTPNGISSKSVHSGMLLHAGHAVKIADAN